MADMDPVLGTLLPGGCGVRPCATPEFGDSDAVEKRHGVQPVEDFGSLVRPLAASLQQCADRIGSRGPSPCESEMLAEAEATMRMRRR